MTHSSGSLAHPGSCSRCPAAITPVVRLDLVVVILKWGFVAIQLQLFANVIYVSHILPSLVQFIAHYRLNTVHDCHGTSELAVN